jgi:hypothetical protein
MVENMRFRVTRSGHEDVVLSWDETVDVIESGEWTGIQVFEHELYPEPKND